jgi:hypothetical protein
MICTPHQILFKLERMSETGAGCNTYGERGKMNSGFWWWKLLARDRVQDRKTIFNKWKGEAWAGLFWLRIGTRGGLWMWLWISGFHKMRAFSWLSQGC